VRELNPKVFIAIIASGLSTLRSLILLPGCHRDLLAPTHGKSCLIVPDPAVGYLLMTIFS
jgi:hypothetical protein